MGVLEIQYKRHNDPHPISSSFWISGNSTNAGKVTARYFLSCELLHLSQSKFYTNDGLGYSFTSGA